MSRMVRSWNELSKFYGKTLESVSARDWPALLSMEKLVRTIETSSYASGLFAWQSHWDLCIAQTEVEYPYDGPYLAISPLGGDKIEFRYIDTRMEANQWRKTIDGCDAFARLETFIEQMCWFVRYETASK